MKARCCWIWRLSIYGAVLSETSTTCTSKRWGAFCLCYTCLTPTALINPASWTVAVKAKGICQAIGEATTKRTKAQWRHTIKKEEVNDAQMCCFFSQAAKTTCCCWVCTEERVVGMIWKVTKPYFLGSWIWIRWPNTLLYWLTEALLCLKGTVQPNMNYLLTLFQNSMAFFLLWNTNSDFLKNVSTVYVYTVEVNGVQNWIGTT